MLFCPETTDPLNAASLTSSGIAFALKYIPAVVRARVELNSNKDIAYK